MYAGGLDNTLEKGVYNRTASIFFILAILMFTPPFTAVQTFSLERGLFYKERKDKLYSTSSWLFAKSAVTFPLEGILCLAFCSISYFMVGYQPRADKFFIFFAMMLLLQLCMESSGLLFSILCKSPVYAIVWYIYIIPVNL